MQRRTREGGKLKKQTTQIQLPNGINGLTKGSKSGAVILVLCNIDWIKSGCQKYYSNQIKIEGLIYFLYAD